MTEPTMEGVGEPAAPVQAEPGFLLGREPFAAEIDPGAPDAEEGALLPAAVSMRVGDVHCPQPAPTGTRSRAVRRRRHAAAAACVLLDAIAVGASALVGLACAATLGVHGMSLGFLALLVPVTLVSFALLHGMYGGNALRLIPSGLAVSAKVAHALPWALLGAIGLGLAWGASGSMSLAAAAVILCAVVPTLVLVPLLRSSVHNLGGRLGVIRPQRVVVLGAGEAADNVMQRLRRHGGIEPLGMVDDDPLPGFETIGRVADLDRLCRELQADRVIVAIPRVPWIEVSEIVRPMIGTVDIAIVPSLYELMTWRSGTADLAGMPLVPLVPAQQGMAARFSKRAVDVVLGSAALVVTGPILLAAALAIKIDSRGPVFFRQARSGLGGGDFRIWKLRTMDVGSEGRRDELMAQSEADGPRFKMARDPRVTTVGRLLRRFSIDELPQLFNVIDGSMSLVGPRPFPVAEYGALSQGPAAARFDMRPGMTGLWQVSGRSDLTWDDLCRLDSVYVASWSVLWDLRILLQTPVAVLRQWGAY